MIPLGFPGHQIGGVHRAAAGHEATHGLTFFFSAARFSRKKWGEAVIILIMVMKIVVVVISWLYGYIM